MNSIKSLLESSGISSNKEFISTLELLQKQIPIALGRINTNDYAVADFLKSNKRNAYEVVDRQLVCVPTGDAILDFEDKDFIELCNMRRDDDFHEFGYTQGLRRLTDAYPEFENIYSERLWIAHSYTGLQDIVIYDEGNGYYYYVNKLSYFKKLLNK